MVTSSSDENVHQSAMRRVIARRAANSLLVLAGILLLTFLALHLAQQGRQGLPVTVRSALTETLRQTVNYLTRHPKEYIWHKEIVPAGALIFDLFTKSLGLLLVSMAAATLIGGGLGVRAALARNKAAGPLIVAISILGMSTPSFLLGMLFWVVNVKTAGWLRMDQAPLPPVGFGWDLHLIMPALVLAARPIAQIMQVTYVSLSDVLNQDYMRLAKAKGLSERLQLAHHALKNITIPVLTTLGTSLRFALASLPVVESFFLWEGLGLAILQAFTLDMPTLVADLIVSLGVMFLLINQGLEIVYPLIDARLRKQAAAVEDQLDEAWQPSAAMPIKEALAGLKRSLAGYWNQLTGGWSRKPARVPRAEDVEYARKERKRIARAGVTNLPLVVGSLMILALLGLAIFGAQMAAADPFESHNIMIIEGQVYGPPFEPSSVFAWGSDALGRDIQALVLHGAKQTLSLALFAMLARVMLGLAIGMAAGWWRHSWFDQIVSGLINVWAAFPVTVFAMLIILSLGIERGINVFIIAFCVVGWGEIAQFVRGQVIAQKPALYIEAARSVGAGAGQILTNHILPHLIPSVLVMAVMEMGGVLMLLADLGFLNIFLGGGFRVDLFGVGIYHFSDIPEWGSLLANIRNWWRSYPWVAWYPGMMFFFSILAFNVWGEGLRRFLEESRINLNRFMNRYTASAAVGLAVITVVLFRSATPMGMYRSQALEFNAANTLADIEALSSPAFAGRESGTDGNMAAAEFIALRMEEIGLFPAGEKNTYIQALRNPRFHLTQMPRLEILDETGAVREAFTYREDFVERIDGFNTFGLGAGMVTGVALGAGERVGPVILMDPALYERVLVMREEVFRQVTVNGIVPGVLVVTDDASVMEKKYLSPFFARLNFPVMNISEETAERLLATAGSSLAELDALGATLPPDKYGLTGEGSLVSVSLLPDEEGYHDRYINVIGYIPGIGSDTGARGQGMDSQVIVVSAYFDGLGTGPDGTLYAGANDNASGVASMLEIARVLKEGDYQPKKTIVFVAWSGGERFERLVVNNVMNAKTGFTSLTVEAVMQLSGVGYGTGSEVAIDPESSYRLIALLQEAGERLNIPVTTRGRGPHFGLASFARSGSNTAVSAMVSWDGSDHLAHTVLDTPQIIDVEKIQKVGELMTLAVTMLGREIDY